MDYADAQITGVSFRLFTEPEAKKLSVIHVKRPESLDPLGHPYENGLQDTSFGPLKRDDFCKTCGLTDITCLGHYGTVELPLPVFNPFLMKHLSQVLKMCCFNCHHLLYSASELELYIAQLRALHFGLDFILPDLIEYANEIRNGNAGFDWRSIDGQNYMRGRLNDKINGELFKLKNNNVKAETHELLDEFVANIEDIEIVNSKYVVEKKQQLFKDFFAGKVLKPARQCHACQAHKAGMNVINRSVIVLSLSKAAKSMKKFDETDLNISIEVKGKTYLTPSDARQHLRLLWGNEESTLKRIFPFINFDLEELTGQLPEELTPEDGLPSKYCPLDVFFWETLIIAPNRFRPLRVLRGRSFEHYKTSMLAEIMIVAQGMDYWLKSAKDKASSDSIQKFHHQWQRLQTLCNRLYDSEMDKLPDNKAIGVKQILEKKEGLLRKNMMGKRVNFAARSVISPDPYIAADEIGIPVIFATRLYYPQPVAPWNMNQLEQAIINGPLVWPGAMSVKFPDGNVVRLSATKEDQRKKIAAMIRMPKENLDQFGGYIVNRHLISGDTLLLNRQPTLHKPSIMAHKARVLPKEKTLRLHYANCKSYNADFDGDEMNAHFPQSELARAEAYEIASVNYQFLVPKDGSPLSGLIQDHIIAGFFLSVRGSYFNKGDYQNLVFGALSFLNKPIKLLPPAIMKPSELWTGKQIISTLVINIVPDGKQLPSFDIDSKIKPKMFVNDTPEEEPFNGGLPMKDSDMCESQVIFRQGELLCGVMDKVNFGANKNGLIHVCYELYGQDIHTKLLTAVARLSTNYVQCVSGFTLGIHDILVRSKPNKQRKKLMKVSTTVGPQAFADAFNLKETFEENQITEELIHEKMSMAQTSRDDFYLKQLDAAYKQQTDKLSNEISSACMPKGLVKQFPSNNLQMMIQTGAKGGAVNAIQISCLLGQIELEGRRIPLMMSGRTLPSFKKYDITPRAGGFIAGRFLTGIRPQEFFFHCMAGREGLIDTAVKTSRSGYLQRCLIKHLEGLVVNYDMTVRDSEGSVIQWMYGEDGCDIIKCQSLHKSFLPIIMKNQEVFKPSKEDIKRLKKARQADVSKLMKEVRESVKAHENVRYRSSSGLSKFSDKYLESFSNATQAEIQDQWLRLTNEERISYDTPRTKDPVISTYTPNVNFGAISESLDSIIENYINSDLAQSDKKLVKSFKQSMNNCYMRSLAAPGEAVGLLAAQSIGEPSTQMTLNTFHFAGRGEMNVTLGVPRLRELLMTASPNISNPSMEIPIRTDLPIDMDIAAEAEKVRIQINAVRLKDVLEYVDVEEKIVIVPKQLHQRFRSYKVRFNFLPRPLYKTRCFTKPAKIIHFMESSFIKQFIEALSKKFRILQSRSGLFDTRTIINRTSKKTVNADEEEIVMSTVQNEYEEQDNKRFQMEEDEEEAEDAEFCDVDAGEGDTTAMRHKSRFNQDQEYEEKDEEENEKNDDDSDEESDDVKKPKSASKVKEEVEDMEEEMAKMFGTSAVKLTTAKKTTKKGTIDQQEQVKAYMNERKQRVLNIGRGTVIDYDYDIENELWCEVTMQFELYSTKLDLRSVIYEEASKAFIHRLGRVDRAFLVKDNDAAKKGARYDQLVKTEGVSMAQVVHFDSILDIKRIYTNDMHAIANTFGIEAARNALIREISSVFAVYGISVDGRHLTLIADHMTFSGKIKGMNRASMDGISPLQAMTFETTTAFMKNSLLMNLSDDLKSPSSRLVIGRPTMVGSGLFETRVNPKLMEEFLGKKTALPTTVTAEPCPETGVQIPIPHSLSSKNRFSLSAFKRKRPLTPVDEDGGDQPEPISEDAQSEQVNLKNVKLELFDETIEEPVATKRVKTEYISDAE